MLISAIDRWLDERGLVVDVDAPYYTVVLYRPAGPTLLTAEGTTLTEAFRRMFELADERQRQQGERWALRENPAFHVTTEHLDAVLEDREQFLGLQAGQDPRYAGYFVARDGSGTSRAIFGGSLEAVATSVALEQPSKAASLPELERQYRAMTGSSFGEAVEAQRRGVTPLPRDWLKSRRLRKKMQTAGLRHRAIAMARLSSPSRAAEELGIPRSTLLDWIRAEAPPPPAEPLTYAEIAPIVEEAGSLEAAARELGRPIEEVAHVYYRDERFVRRLPLETAPSFSALALEVAREYGVREASRQFGVEEDLLRDALIAAESR